MLAFLSLEASQSKCGRKYRFEFGCGVHPGLASMVLMIARLF